MTKNEWLTRTLATERPANWPIPSFDARDWAREFCRIAKTKGHDLDEGWMITWFANALMRGWDEHARRTKQSNAQGMEARRGETAGLDAKRDSPVAEGEAPNDPFREISHTGSGV